MILRGMLPFAFKIAMFIAVPLAAISSVAAAEVEVAAEHFGNCSWDGTQDVAPCIQSAVDSTGSKGGIVHLPPGTWPLSHLIIAGDNVTLDGEDKANLVPQNGNVSNPVLLNIRTGAKDVVVKGIIFDGGGAGFSSDKPIISGTSVSHVLFDDITVRNTHGVGLLLQGGTKNSGAQRSRFINIGNYWKMSLERKDRLQGLVFCCGTGNEQNFAIDNYFKDIGLDALQIGDQNSFTAKKNTFELSNEQFTKLKSGDYPAAIFAIASRNVSIEDNTIRNSPGNGIDAPGLQDSTIAHNTIVGSGGAGIGIFIGYDNHTQAQNLSIIGNTISNNVHWLQATFVGGITISGGTPSDITISGNTVTDTQVSKTQKYGVYVRRDTKVSNLKIDPNNRLSGNSDGATHTD